VQNLWRTFPIRALIPLLMRKSLVVYNKVKVEGFIQSILISLHIYKRIFSIVSTLLSFTILNKGIVFMNSISVKLGVLFFIVVISLESIFSLYLFFSLQDSRIQEELEELRARGNSHRSVLEKYYNEETIFHVALMETEADTDVVITDAIGNIVATSQKDDRYDEYVQAKHLIVPRGGLILEEKWSSKQYIATVSPIMVEGETVGLVYMFKSTKPIQEMTTSLRNHFLTVGIVIIILSVISIAIFTKSITNPLIRMKMATEKLSQGDFTVSLNVTTKDEVGQLAMAIEKLAQDLNHIKKERNEFLASIAHELRTPLTYIKGYADVVSRENINNDERKHYLTIIKEETKHLSGLVKNLFDLARVDQNHFQVSKQRVNLHGFLERIVRKVTPTYHQRSILIALTGNQDIKVEIDMERFEQVITNLLDNSLKYSDEHTKVDITFFNDKQFVFIKINDQGIGIPQEDMPYIFDRLYRVEKSRSRSSGGAGLGLSIAKEIIEAHGGVISIVSSVNVGTIITIRLDRC
jgi:signal transduction histidine kinase